QAADLLREQQGEDQAVPQELPQQAERHHARSSREGQRGRHEARGVSREHRVRKRWRWLRGHRYTVQLPDHRLNLEMALLTRLTSLWLFLHRVLPRTGVM